ncbi:MAG: hypothetical protein Tsb0034_27200 [Ekhidna sp.]
MKKLTQTTSGMMLTALMLIVSLRASAQSGTINQTERDFLVNYLSVSLEETKTTLDEVDETLWQYKPADGGWSIGECMEHIILAEQALFKQVKGALQQEATDGKSLARKDGYVITRTVDRGSPANTPLKPEAVRMNKKAYLKELKSLRKDVIAYVQQPDLELRNHFGKSPFGEVDAYQLVLIIAGHGMRHTAQMKEVIEEYKGTTASK